MLLPEESIRNFADRLNTLTNRVHDTITDAAALNDIKYTKFISSISSNLRIKIQEESNTDYKLAVYRAQNLQEIMQNEKILQSCTSTSSTDSVSLQLKHLTEKVTAISLANYTEKDT